MFEQLSAPDHVIAMRFAAPLLAGQEMQAFLAGGGSNTWVHFDKNIQKQAIEPVS